MEKTNSDFFKSQWFLWIMLIFIPIVGIVLLWKYRFYNVVLRIFISVIFGLVFIFMILMNLPNLDESPSPVQTNPPAVTKPSNQEPPPPNLESVLSEIIQNLDKHIINNYKNSSWVQDFSRYEVYVYPDRSSVVKLYTTLTQKNGNEIKIADAVGTYFSPTFMSKNQLKKVKLLVYNKNGETIHEKIIEHK